MSEREESLMIKLLRFTKIEHTIFSVPLLFAGAWLGAGRQMPPLESLGLILLAGIGARILGMAMNRILDRKLDALNPRTENRELPSGKLSVRAAWATAIAGLIVYLTACALAGPLVLLLSPIPAVVLIGYSLLKRFSSLCHFGIGACLGLAPTGAHVVVRGDLSIGVDGIALAVFAFFWITGFDIIYALQDIEADRKNGVHSIPAALGAKWAQFVAALLHVIAFASAAVILYGQGSILSWVALAILACALIAAQIPRVPLPMRFFPISAIAGIAGAIVPFG